MGERAVDLEQRFLGHEFGSWTYVRQIDSWWCDEGRACVVVRGIEHTMPDEEEGARNAETVIQYGLRRYKKQWIIATWSQGWPRFGSAPALRGNQEWRKAWMLTERRN
jgi:hypothetical protein